MHRTDPTKQDLTEQDLDDILNDSLFSLENIPEEKPSDSDSLDPNVVLEEVTLEYSKQHNSSQQDIELDDEDLDCSVLPKDSNRQSNTQGLFPIHPNHFLSAWFKSPGMTAMLKDKNFLSMTANNGMDIFISMARNNPQLMEQMNALHDRYCTNPDCKCDTATLLSDPDFKKHLTAGMENIPDEMIESFMADESLNNLVPIMTNPENVKAYFDHPDSAINTATIFNNSGITDSLVETFSDPELIKATLNTKNSEQDIKLKETITTICNDHPELENIGIDIANSVNLKLAIKTLLAATTINEQEDSESTKLLKAAGNKVGIAGQEARNLSIKDKQKLLLYVTETTKLIKNPKTDLNQYSTYITEAIGMNSSTGKHIALAMLTVAGVILLLATIALIVGLAAASCGASIPFSALVITGLGGTLTAGFTTAAVGVTGLGFATFGGIFAERTRKGDIHLAMDNFSKMCRLN